MDKSISNEVVEERVILFAVCTSDEKDVNESLDELEELVKTAGAITIGRTYQNRDKFHNVTYVGKGKLEELGEMVGELNATGIVCDDELTPIQLRNIQDAIGVKVMDRTMVILDIFAQRAQTREGIIQVEIAQLKYRSTRLVGLGISMSKLGAGIGSKGPGEKKLELDRRHIKDRMAQLYKELDEVKRHRNMIREQRKKTQIPVIAIVGYTNAGKSTILNKLTNAGVLEEDKLFATLDPTTRSLSLPSGQQVLLTDTVGFIRKLPHHLIQAFKSTLEEAVIADILMHVVDSSSVQLDKQMHVVYDTLTQLGAIDKPIITVFNKQDKIEGPFIVKDLKAEKMAYISAKSQAGLPELLYDIEDMLKEQKKLFESIIPYSATSMIQTIRKYGQILVESYENDGILVKAYLPKETYDMVQGMLKKL
jgi:GTP-binding protein HflX